VRFSHLVIALAIVSGLVVSTTAVRSAQPGLAYDEVTRIVLGQAAPDPGNFPADFQAAVNAQRAVAGGGTHGGLFGSIMNAVDMARNAVNMLQTGTASTEYYLGGSRRTDDVGAQTGTIFKASPRETIYLDMAKQTYRIETPNYQFASETPPPLERMRNPSGRPAQPGSGRLTITVSVTSLGAMRISNVPTTGYRTAFSMTETQSTGSCADGTFQVTMTEYLSPYAEPRVSSGGVAPRRTSIPRPEMMALKPGCTPTIVTHTSGGTHVPSGRLSMWSLITIGGSAPTAEGRFSGGFSTLIERGNVRQLTSNDRGLFEIPSGYARAQ